MAVAWTQHRFAGGALALDVANTVVLRADPARRFDRLEQASELPRFAEAASRFRRAEVDDALLHVEPTEPARRRMIAMREAIDALFRRRVVAGHVDDRLLPRLLRVCATGIEAQHQLSGQQTLEAATAYSALALLAPEQRRRVRICDNCGWLFIDRSRNGSRRWCDMNVCGNRNKARRHYQRWRTGYG